MSKNFLCADIGGTHSRFAFFVSENNTLYEKKQYICPTTYLRTTQDVFEAAACTGLSPEKADFFCLGFAGMIEHDGLGAQLTNAALHVNFRPYTCLQLQKNFLLVNDFALQAWASLAEEIPLLPVLPSKPSKVSKSLQFCRGILGAGTGLGTAALIPFTGQGEGWLTLPAEGGHVDMPFYGKEEQDFALFAQNFLQQERIRAEDILAAKGLSLLHSYVHGQQLSPQEAASHLWKNGQESLQLQLYARFLGRFCRHWALSILCKGGLYLGGGVLMKNSAIVQSASFLEEFYKAPSAQLHFLKELPVFLMQHENPGLLGAAYMAQMHCADFL